jgi:hypothetical protein
MQREPGAAQVAEALTRIRSGFWSEPGEGILNPRTFGQKMWEDRRMKTADTHSGFFFLSDRLLRIFATCGNPGVCSAVGAASNSKGVQPWLVDAAAIR